MSHLFHLIYGVIDIVLYYKLVLLKHKHCTKQNEYRFKIDLYSVILILKFT